MADAPFALVNGPRFTPLPYGLMSVAQIVDDPDLHWQAGTIFEPDVCAPANAHSGVFCSPDPGLTKEPLATEDASAAEPFNLYAWVACAPVGWGDDLADLEAKTVRALDAGEDRTLGRVFWTGQPDQGDVIHPHLDSDEQLMVGPHGATDIELQSAATDVGGGDPVSALAAVEAALADCYGGQGVIHVPRVLLPFLAKDNLVTVQGPQLHTLGGNLVAAYATTDTTIYGTGAVMLRRSPVKRRGQRPADYVGRTDNSTVFVVERTYVIDWDCCHFRASVDLSG